MGIILLPVLSVRLKWAPSGAQGILPVAGTGSACSATIVPFFTVFDNSIRIAWYVCRFFFIWFIRYRLAQDNTAAREQPAARVFPGPAMTAIFMVEERCVKR